MTQADGLALPQRAPQVTEVISVETARTMMQLLQAVVRFGTGAAASQLNHPLGGKTGTTNNYTDAWFVGFSPSVTCGTWIGYDNRQSLGEKETGARAALPIWTSFMRAAIAGRPNERFATGGAPKKVFDLPISGPGNEDVQPATDKKSSESDVDPEDVEPAKKPGSKTDEDGTPPTVIVPLPADPAPAPVVRTTP